MTTVGKLVNEVDMLVEQAHKLAAERGPYPDGEMGYRLTVDGIVFFDKEPNQYEEGDHVVELPPITWHDIENPTAAIARFREAAATEAQRRQEAQAKWERETYERLKPKFEP